jgi:hypothetical protein
VFYAGIDDVIEVDQWATTWIMVQRFCPVQGNWIFHGNRAERLGRIVLGAGIDVLPYPRNDN